MPVTLAELTDAVADTLADAASLGSTQSYNEITEGAVDLPSLQVFPLSFAEDSSGGETDRKTFQAGVRVKDIGIRINVFAAIRQNLAENMTAYVTLMDELIDIIEAQDTKPYFGLEGIKSFRWNFEHVIFEHGAMKIVGAQLDIVLGVF
jgi:hypothetical protein